MTIAELFEKKDLERSVLIGYYGGGNFGDELLLEVLMNMFASHNVSSLTVTYQHLERYNTYHHEFGYKRIDMADKLSVFKSILKNKNVVIGGGGLWGLDVNPNIFILSSLLFVSRFILRKKVYLLGVGYYNSTSRLGHLSAWLAGRAAHYIVARDDESLHNFRTVSKHVALDTDIAYHIPSLDLTPYQSDFEALDQMVKINTKTLFITLRRFRPHQNNSFTKYIDGCIAKNPDMNIIVATLEPKEVDPEGYRLTRAWEKRYTNVQAVDFSYNPLALYLLFQKHKDEIALIGPQFHAIITALLAGVTFFPVVYDNKVLELLKKTTNKQPVHINDLTQTELQQFIDKFKQTTN